MIENKMALGGLLIIFLGIIHPALFGVEPSENKKYYVAVSLFSGELRNSESSQKISEDQVAVLQLTPLGKDDTLFQQIKNSFQGDIKQIRNEAKGRFAIPSNNTIGNTNWIINDFIIKVNLDTPPQLAGSGRILLFDTNKNLNYVKEFQLEKDATVLAFIRTKDKLVLVALQEVKYEAQPGTEDIYHTIYHTENKTCVIYSQDSSWDGDSFFAEEILFNGAKAVIHTSNGDIILKGETILFYRKDQVMVGFKAILIDQNGKTHGNNNKITVSLAKPMDFKIE